MVHLAVKSFRLETATVMSLGVCNDINAMYKGLCDQESQFIPIMALVRGLFGVNMEVNVNGFNYYITNQHYHGHVCKSIVSTTAEYIIRNKNDSGIGVYLELINCTSDQGLTDVLMQQDRWLSIDEVTFIHGTRKAPGRDHRTLLPHL